MPQQGEIWPLKLIFVLALLAGLVMVWDPAVLSGSPSPPDRSTAFVLLGLAALAAAALAFPQLLFWTKGASSGAVATLNANITTLDRNVTTLDGKVTTLDGNVTTLDPKVTNLNATLAAANLAKLARDLATVTAAIPSLQAGIASLQTAIQNIDQNTAACCADLKSAVSAAANDISALKVAVRDAGTKPEGAASSG